MALKRLRYRLFSGFSEDYRVKLRMMDERPIWVREGYAYDHIRSTARVCLQTQAVFVPVLKAANTAIKHAMATRQGGGDSFAINEAPAAFGLPTLWRSGITPADLESGARRCFTVVRHPVARFWSAYAHLCRREPGSLLANAVREHGGLAGDAEIAPEDLLVSIEEVEQGAREPHTRDQWALSGWGRIPFAAVGRQEELRAFVDQAARDGLLPPWAPEHLSRHNSSGAIPTGFADKALEPRITACYAKDFEAFGY